MSADNNMKIIQHARRLSSYLFRRSSIASTSSSSEIAEKYRRSNELSSSASHELIQAAQTQLKLVCNENVNGKKYNVLSLVYNINEILGNSCRIIRHVSKTGPFEPNDLFSFVPKPFEPLNNLFYF